MLEGGVGKFLRGKHFFGLKVVSLKKNGSYNENFWNEAKSLHCYGSSVRFLAGVLKVPFTPQYYIRENNAAGETNGLSIGELFRIYGITSSDSIEYQDYIPVPEQELKRIYEEEEAADLLMIYPIVNGGEKNLTDYYENFSAEDAAGLIRQIMHAIVDLYHCGRAHGDIKPENIMVSQIGEKKCFRLTDFGSFHSKNLPSNTGTEVFFNSDLYYDTVKKTGSKVTARAVTDCFALSRTVYALAIGRNPVSLNINGDLVTKKWKEIGDLWKKISNPHELTIEEMEQIAAGDPVRNTSEWTPFYSYCSEGIFDSMLTVNNRLDYGKFHEPITFTDDGEFDPLMRLCGPETFQPELRKAIPEFFHTPLITGHQWEIFHAPDEKQTGKRPHDFENYTPKTLANTKPDPEEIKTLLSYGRKLNTFFRKHPTSFVRWLPGKEQIFWCDGKMKLLWGTGKKRRVDYKAYFQYLATGKADFSAEDWISLLPILPELKNKLTAKKCLPILEYFSQTSSPDSISWIFGIKEFREGIAGSKLLLPPKHWLALCRFTDGFDHGIDLDTAWNVFCRAEKQLRNELKKRPVFAAFLDQIPSIADPEEYYKAFYKRGKWDPETFTRWFSEKTSMELSFRKWNQLLRANPDLFPFMPEKYLQRLPENTWVRLLTQKPELAEQCPKRSKFTSAEWTSILCSQPQLRKICPETIVFSEDEENRLKRKAAISAADRSDS